MSELSAVQKSHLVKRRFQEVINQLAKRMEEWTGYSISQPDSLLPQGRASSNVSEDTLQGQTDLVHELWSHMRFTQSLAELGQCQPSWRYKRNGGVLMSQLVKLLLHSTDIICNSDWPSVNSSLNYCVTTQ